jgi:two-component system, NtrC family, nitrogen regulation response regulator NtrX
MSTLLIVDDMKMLRDQYSYDVRRKTGFEIHTASNGKEALDVIASEDIDVAIIDIEMPVMDGLELIEQIRKTGYDDIAIIVYTAEGNFERCVRAIKSGAYNFFDKNEVSIDQLVRIIENAIEHRRLMMENKQLRRKAGIDSELIGESNAIIELREQIRKIAAVPSNVLILGESGTGKELVAKEIHRVGQRAKKPFIALNCAAIPENLVESELFGFEKGAFTGANRSSKGKFEIADGGTLFLDEIGDMPLLIQAKLLRVLETGEITRLGSQEKSLKVDVRVITATHRDLLKEIETEKFRKDLYYRICTHVIKVPSLRERKEDIRLLVEYFLSQTCERFGIPTKNISNDTIAMLEVYNWQMNNVRELENIVERMIISCNGNEILPDHIPSEIRGEESISSPQTGKTLQELKYDSERRIVIQALRENNWHLTNTAKTLGISNHSNLIKIMKRLDIQRPD